MCTHEDVETTFYKSYLEQLGVVVQIKVVKSKSTFFIDSLQGGTTMFHNGHSNDRLRLSTVVKGSQSFGILLFCHAIMQHGLQGRDRTVTQSFRQDEAVSFRQFETCNRDITCLANTACIRTKGRSKGHSRTKLHLPERSISVGGIQKGFLQL
jgi:hypothetical protein